MPGRKGEGEMLDATARASMTRSEIVSYYLRLIALRVNPRTGHLTALAEELGVHPTTISAWIDKGYVPEFQVKKLVKRFGKKTVSLDELCPPEFRL
jgi:hypothetical protein